MIKNNKFTLNAILYLFVIFTFASISGVLSLTYPQSGLDPSWANAANQAVAQGLIFGEEFIFTFGPYASVYTGMYHPDVDSLTTLGSILITFALIVSVLFLYQNNWFLLVVLCVFLAAYNSSDALLFFLPFCLSMLVFRIFNDEVKLCSRSCSYRELIVILLFSVLGLLPLVKVSTFFICSVSVVLSFFYLVLNKRIFLSILVLFLPVISSVALWLYSGQSFDSLYLFLKNSTPIVSGYTEGMSIYGRSVEVFLFLVVCGWGAWVFFITEKRWKERVFVFLICGVFLFLSFKAAFTRHDAHAMIAACSIVIAALTISALYESKKRVRLWLLGCASVWLFISVSYEPISFVSFKNKVVDRYEKALKVLYQRIFDTDSITEGYLASKDDLHSQKPIFNMKGKADIYSYQQSYLLASDNHWKPRPVIQSYSAYTAELLRINSDFLAREGADNILYNVETIDGRYPTLDDGASLPIILNGYKLVNYEHDILYYKRKTNGRITSVPDWQEIKTNRKFDQEIMLPKNRDNLFVEIDIKPSLLGRIMGVFFKHKSLSVVVENAYGQEKKYRYIASMGRSPFLISPLIKENKDLIALTSGETDLLFSNYVSSFRIEGGDGSLSGWKKNFDVRFSSFSFPSSGQDLNHYNDQVNLDLVSNPELVVSDCNGFIDSLNGIAPQNRRIPSGVLSVEGWLVSNSTMSPDAGETYIYLLDDAGEYSFFNVEKTVREDVKVHFGKLDMIDPGYISTFKTNGFYGEYKLGLARGVNGDVEICNNPQVDIVFIKD